MKDKIKSYIEVAVTFLIAGFALVIGMQLAVWLIKLL
jgi:hypothetical protein